jgi:hypothetical protein
VTYEQAQDFIYLKTKKKYVFEYMRLCT